MYRVLKGIPDLFSGVLLNLTRERIRQIEGKRNKTSSPCFTLKIITHIFNIRWRKISEYSMKRIAKIWDISIQRGIITGFNEAFIMYGAYIEVIFWKPRRPSTRIVRRLKHTNMPDSVFSLAPDILLHGITHFENITYPPFVSGQDIKKSARNDYLIKSSMPLLLNPAV